ncbi:hypothetical protein KKG58_01015 [Patescibacteria group bacterium]|nr:hypothetical protein [Patescibacteria group bacterium]
MKEKEIYKNEVIQEKEQTPEKEPYLSVPIIDIIRHGETDYKELTKCDFRLDSSSADFKLDEDHLDLNQKGIKNILNTAEKLEARIDKEKEVVLFITSPNYRAESSMLLIKDHLAKSGILTIDKYLRSHNIEQIRFKSKEEGGQVDVDEWIHADKKFRNEESQQQNIPPEKAHQRITERLGKKWDEIFKEGYDEIDKRFERFIRHIVNLNMYFSDETKAGLKNKRIRVVILTHEEIPSRFIQKIWGDDIVLQKAQNLELQPNAHMLKGKDVNVKATLHPKEEKEPIKEAFLKKKFF